MSKSHRPVEECLKLADSTLRWAIGTRKELAPLGYPEWRIRCIEQNRYKMARDWETWTILARFQSTDYEDNDET